MFFWGAKGRAFFVRKNMGFCGISMDICGISIFVRKKMKSNPDNIRYLSGISMDIMGFLKCLKNGIK